MTNCEILAQEDTGKVTVSELLSLAKSCDLSLHGEALYNRPSYSDSFVFTVSGETGKRDSKVKIRHEMKVPGRVSNGRGLDGSTHRPTGGFWWLFGAMDRLRDLLEILPKKAHVSFAVALDHGTTEGQKKHGMHTDYLYLHVHTETRGQIVTRAFLIDTACGEHNTARFGAER